MNKFRLSLYHVVLITFLLMILKILSTGFYNYIYMRHAAFDQARLQVVSMMHARLSLLIVQSNKSELLKEFHMIEVDGQKSNRFLLTTSKHTPSNALVLPTAQHFTDEQNFSRLVHSLYNNKNLVMSTYFPTIKRWAVFKPIFHPTGNWIIPTSMLVGGTLILVALWVLFFYYYRKSIPSEILSFLTGRRDKGSKEDKTIRDLTDKIEQIFEEKNIMLTALSHDIKTPLTESMLQLELLEDQKTAESIKEKLMSINSIINTSLDFSREPDKINKVETDALSLLESIAENYRHFGFNATVLATGDNFDWPLEHALFRRLIINIFDNAKKYAAGCHVDIHKENGSEMVLTFTDDGEGVPNKVLHKLSTPYYRVDQSRSSDTGGTGLGLAIVKKIAQLHNGKVEFNNAKPKGFQVIVRLYSTNKGA